MIPIVETKIRISSNGWISIYMIQCRSNERSNEWRKYKTGKITDDVWSLDYKQIGQNVTNTIQQLDAKY